MNTTVQSAKIEAAAIREAREFLALLRADVQIISMQARFECTPAGENLTEDMDEASAVLEHVLRLLGGRAD